MLDSSKGPTEKAMQGQGTGQLMNAIIPSINPVIHPCEDRPVLAF